jgi:hypothetical protein
LALGEAHFLANRFSHVFLGHGPFFLDTGKKRSILFPSLLAFWPKAVDLGQHEVQRLVSYTDCSTFKTLRKSENVPYQHSTPLCLRRVAAWVHNYRSRRSRPYNIRQLVTSRNRSLYRAVQSQAPILLELSQEATWEGLLLINDGFSLVRMVTTSKPPASFTHELLHIDLELRGLIKPRVFKSEHIPAAELAGTVRDLCNELAHHKTYPRFVEMGFAPHDFLTGEIDAGAEGYIRDVLSKLEGTALALGRVRSLHVGLCYMVIHNAHDVKVAYVERLAAVADPAQISSLESLLHDWKQTDSLDYCPFLARFFACCGLSRVGFGNNAEQIMWSNKV